jgi:hypothetical protein
VFQQPTYWSPSTPPRPPRYPSPTPSGLFPSGPPRPTYREPHPVRTGAVAAGGGAAAVWLLFFGLLGRDVAGYGRWTLLAGLTAWGAALALARHGDRGVATGVAVVVAVGWSVCAVVLAVAWGLTGDWPLW